MDERKVQHLPERVADKTRSIGKTKNHVAPDGEMLADHSESKKRVLCRSGLKKAVSRPRGP